MKKKNIYSRGAMEFGIEILLFLLVLFIIWVLSGGQTHKEAQKPFIKPINDPINPGTVYGPKGN